MGCTFKRAMRAHLQELHRAHVAQRVAPVEQAAAEPAGVERDGPEQQRAPAIKRQSRVNQEAIKM